MKAKIIRIGFLLLFGTIICNSSAYSETWKEFLSNTSWQLQNPVVPSNSEIIGFGKDNKLTYSAMDYSTSEKTNLEGTYSLNGTSIVLRLGDQSAEFELEYISANKIILSNDQKELVLARLASAEDTFMFNYLNNQIYGGTYNNSNSTNGTLQLKRTTCTHCNGTGIDPIPRSVAAYGSTEHHWCDVCKTNVSASHGYHPTCPKCNGKKYTENY